MPRPSPEVLPFDVSNGWPAALSGCVVTIRETGVSLGSLDLDDAEWRVLRAEPVFSLRIDDHPETHGWTTIHPDGTKTHREFEIPLTPVVVPPATLNHHDRTFWDWVMDTHGAEGRLLIWPESRRWWMVQEPDLELVLTCAPPGLFADESDVLSWWDFGTPRGRQEVEELAERYSVKWDE